jgi:hypothetical protein
MYIEGHCAACRYGFMMQLGSVILKVRGREEKEERREGRGEEKREEG